MGRVDVLEVGPKTGDILVGQGRTVYRVDEDGNALYNHTGAYDLVALVERVYIAGPMTGLPSLNFPAFEAEAKRYRARGCHVENPAEINPDVTKPWEECMRLDIPRMLTCDTVVMLPGWQQSKGAKIEHDLALALGMAIVYQNN